MTNTGIRVCVDRGGTFTDVIAFIPNHIHPKDSPKPKELFRPVIVKLLSVDPNNYSDAPREGIRRVLEIATGVPHPRNKPVETKNLELVRMGTTVATNALLERKGEPTVLVITKGFKDILHIGNQARPNLFDLSIQTPDVLFEHVIESVERVTLVGYSSTTSGMKNINIPKNDKSFVQGITGEWVKILQKPDLTTLESELKKVREKGVKSVAVCLMHAYTYPEHEHHIETLCKKLGFENITLSSKTIPMIKLVPRGTSTTADAYLTPCIQKYLNSFFSGFDPGMLNSYNGKPAVKVEFMQSDGGLVDARKFNGFKAILSGPAGGVVGYAATSWEKGGKAVIGFDMGGTSTDVSRFGGQFEHVFETVTAGIAIQAPQLDISTVAAGGGSRLFFRNGMLVVGPESASADPGPACYRKGGPLAITDANLLLGRLDPNFFPKIFGKSEKDPLDPNATKIAFEKIASEINSFLTAQKSGVKPMTIDEIAYGFIKVANESMCRPIRALTQGKGYNAADHILACFGGAGGQHAFAIARSLGINMILIHRYSSILSAYGQALADVVHEVQEPSAYIYSENSMATIKSTAKKLIQQTEKSFAEQGFPKNHVKCELYLNLRYQGTDTAIMTLKPAGESDWDFEKVFLANYKQEFGFTLPGRDILIDDIRVRGTGKSVATGSDVKWTAVHKDLLSLKRTPVTKSSHELSIYWESVGRVNTPVYLLKDLSIGNEIHGPALILDNTATIAVEPNCQAVITKEHVVGYVGKVSKDIDEKVIKCDPILLSVFGHRFMSIAEQMGRTLQKTSISTNIKERLDFSCALFGPDGGLVANAPHIPVHLGSMQEAVKWQMKFLSGKIKEGDVLLTNHPAAGGSHLPDITVITPVFEKGEIVFFVASRGHHADIGGITAGSMPPNSRELFQEGAAIKSFLLVKDGIFDEQGIKKLLLEDPAKFEGCTGTRCLKDNISDLKAQVAANHKGIQLVASLIKEFGLLKVQSYMNFIQENAHHAVSDLLKKTFHTIGPKLHAIDHMDDGSPIELTVSIDEVKGTAVFDFEGTGREVYANTNAPTSVTFSAIIYCLRCLINLDMPLNQGALGPIQIKIPKGSMLNPSETAAVVGGNVLTSQRLCDVIFKAFQACAASQGCCNNLTFGKNAKEDGDGFGYYETIAGGSGAGPTWDGRGGVHTHMTNTRITDPEIMERRYPVILREFSLRSGSGGSGLHKGGDGVIREIEFLETLQLSLLSERRVFQPYGLNGGGSGSVGMNSLIRQTPSGPLELNFGGKNATIVNKGDRIRLQTPGGGGWDVGDKWFGEVESSGT
ncbi:Hydantoinase B/oxoprolinase-domain-containing protein [Globomyces pollinis-pini]|nr:Hydantoinase B/oxoprolinase-domain-containing protein [Globomyces pollinis-pini]